MHRPIIAPVVLGLVMALSACGSGDTSSDPEQAPPAATDAQSTAVTVVAHDLYYEINGVNSNESDLSIDASAGDVAMSLDNQGAAVHNIVIEEEGDALVAEAQAGATASGSIALEPGTYTVYCNIPGHRAAGMELTLRVSG